MLRGVIAVLLLLAAAGCALLSHEAPPEDVDKAAGLFFERLKGAEYDAIFNDAAPFFKKNKTREEVVQNLTQLTSGGRLMHNAKLSTFFTERDNKRVAVTTHATIFENGKGEVKLYFADEAGEWKLGQFEYKVKG
jgi:hypothetical protein